MNKFDLLNELSLVDFILLKNALLNTKHTSKRETALLGLLQELIDADLQQKGEAK